LADNRRPVFALAFTGVVSVTGSPDSGTGAILLIDDEARQDVRITCDVTLDTDCENAGIVFGYVDNQNYWVKIWSKATQTKNLYQVAGGTWTEKSSGAKTITAGVQFEMNIQVRAGQASSYAATVPAGQIGLWCSDSSDNTFDDFVVRDIAGPFDADAAWFSTLGDVQIDESNDNVLTSNPGVADQCIVRRGSRAGWYELIFKFKQSTVTVGPLVRWLSPGDYLAVAVSDSDGKARLYQRSADGKRETKVTSGTTLSLNSGTWYTAKLLVGDDGSGGDRLGWDGPPACQSGRHRHLTGETPIPPARGRTRPR
jgi:hypothetical protein